MKATALIAEDEPLLAANLQAELAKLWPELRICAAVSDGESAVRQGLNLQPDVMFSDISMPGLTGLEAIEALAEEWPVGGKAFPLIVFVTAYDTFAVQAFERAAIDYLIKPVVPDRLQQTCERLQNILQQRLQPKETDASLDAVMNQLRSVIEGGYQGTTTIPANIPPLRVIQAAVGNTIAMVPVDDVIYFEAADKYVRVITAEREYLIRVSLRELEPQLDSQRFWKIHRATIVRCDAIAHATRNDTGKLILALKGHRDKLTVSRLYAHLFKAM